jgi:two-component system nitrate/nitrite response regulator NarL
MEPGERRVACSLVSALIVSEVRFLRDCLAEILVRYPDIEVCGQSASLTDALDAAHALQPAIVLLDVALPGSFDTVAQFSAVAPAADVVALAIVETEENVLAWAEAGVAGYVPNTASVDELVAMLRQINQGEQTCSPRISGTLLRRIAVAGRGAKPSFPADSLTQREFEIWRLLGEGLSNKEIARRLSISLGTTKSHVHNLLHKLSLQRRIEAARLYVAHPAELKPSFSSASILSRSLDR